MGQRDAVTGAYGYSGKYITRRLLDRNRSVVTLTNSIGRRNPFGEAVSARPFNFDAPHKLVESLRGIDTLYNTYWIRFNHRTFSHAEAVRNTMTLFGCAAQAGVRRVVHVSITNPSPDSELEYFRGKAELEEALMASGISHAILRPAVLFGGEDILINNIAWFVRRFPIFFLPGHGSYRLRPIHVDDLAALAVEHGRGSDRVVVDAVGPESFTFRELVETLAAILGKKRLVLPAPPALVHLVARAVGALVGDVVLTREEIAGLMGGKLQVDSPSTGETRLNDWARANACALGRRYASELNRRRDRTRAYG